MNVLVLSDIHSELGKLSQIAERIDLVIVCGDLTSYGNEKDAKNVLRQLKSFKVLAVPGNLDTPLVEKVLKEEKIDLHGKRVAFGEWFFAGFGGGLLENVGQMLFPEEMIKKSLRETAKGKNLVLVTHVPPKNSSLDFTAFRRHIGSKSIRNIIEERKPLVHLCGHIHEAFGEEKINKTLSINAGAVKDGRALMLYLEREIHFKRLNLNE